MPIDGFSDPESTSRLWTDNRLFHKTRRWSIRTTSPVDADDAFVLCTLLDHVCYLVSNLIPTIFIEVGECFQCDFMKDV